jgi:heme oxygenase (mycobilin-producing)
MDGHDSPVVLINLFAVPATADDGFVAGWERARDFLAGQDGYLSTELHRSLAPDADFRFVNVAQWRSAGAFEAAMSHPTSRAGSCRSRRIQACTRWSARTRRRRATPMGWC